MGSKLIGTTAFEKADAPMGVVTGRIDFVGIESAYSFLKEYCVKSQITLNLDEPDFKAIETQSIPELRVIDMNENEITGLGGYLGGIEEECFEVTIYGIPYPTYEALFPDHVQEYFGPDQPS